jgi:hypothetical protein
MQYIYDKRILIIEVIEEKSSEVETIHLNVRTITKEIISFYLAIIMRQL